MNKTDTLKFWRDVEIFNIPIAPSAKDNSTNTKVTTLRTGNQLPWQGNHQFKADKTHTWIHSVYIGVTSTAELAKAVLNAVLPNEQITEQDIGRVAGRGWLAAFAADESGVPIYESYTPASFIYGIQRLRNNESLDGVSDEILKASTQFSERQHRVAQDQEGSLPSITWEEINSELQIVKDQLGELANGIPFEFVIKSVKRKKTPDKNSNGDIDFLNSFFLKDIDQLINQSQSGKDFGKALETYLGSPIPVSRRIDILENQQALATCIAPSKITNGRWPSKSHHHLMLAQQAAVYESTSTLSEHAGIIGVNGPPGTGKTTLLCDVIAEIVVDRAKKIAALNKPSEVFEKNRVKVGNDDIVVLRKDIVEQTGIVVTSNNNTAVENITQELPAIEKLSSEYGAISYFDEVATGILKNQNVKNNKGEFIKAWGLVAAALGNSSNRRNFSWAFFKDTKSKTSASTTNGSSNPSGEIRLEAPISSSSITPTESNTSSEDNEISRDIKEILEECTSEENKKRWFSEWKTAKQDFHNLLKQIELTKKELGKIWESLQQLAILREELKKLSARTIAFQKESSARKESFERIQRDLQAQIVITTHAKETLEEVRKVKPPRFWDEWLLNFFEYKTKRTIDYESRLVPAQELYSDEASKLRELRNRANEVSIQIEHDKSISAEIRKTHSSLSSEIKKYQKVLDDGKSKLGNRLPDDDFWEFSNREKHIASLWLTKDIDILRSKLFLHAIKLHELTIRACPIQFIVGFRHVKNMIGNSLQSPISSEARKRLWDMLFFAIPVVSTTLASFDRLFEDVGQEALGWLLIDEAGQATPQSVAGAIWRSKRAIIVGDPIQIEPIFTVPSALVTTLRKRHHVENIWSPSTESAQTLADRVTLHGSWVGNKDNGGIWTGMPLRAHRRCDSPMFDIANRIAYSGQMVQAKELGVFTTFQPEQDPSSWYGIETSVSNGPVREVELLLLKTKLQAIKDNWPCTIENGEKIQATIFVISPFRKVVAACRQVIKELGLDEQIDSGTVHSFQGKQAEIVFIVLGSAPGKTGVRARDWASAKPNLLNVALTRAKSRVYVIGSYQDWSLCNNFHEMGEMLPIVSM